MNTIIHSDQVEFIPRMKGQLDIQYIINVICNLNSSKKESHMIVSIDAKSIWQNSLSINDLKKSHQIRNRMQSPKSNKDDLQKSNLKKKSYLMWKPDHFPLKVRNKLGCPFSPLKTV